MSAITTPTDIDDVAPNTRRFRRGHRLQFTLTSDDQPKEVPVSLGFRHEPVGSTSRNTVTPLPVC